MHLFPLRFSCLSCDRYSPNCQKFCPTASARSTHAYSLRDDADLVSLEIGYGKSTPRVFASGGPRGTFDYSAAIRGAVARTPARHVRQTGSSR